MDLFSLMPQVSIADEVVPVTIEEIYNDTLTTTEHPIETGAAITDHAYKNPAELTLRCGWTQSSLAAIAGALQSFFSSGNGASSSTFGSRYIDGIYSHLVKYQEDRTLLKVQGSRRKYENMLIIGLQTTTDKETYNILSIEIRLKQIFVVTTQATTLPTKSAQGSPQDTASPIQAGAKQLTPATPSTGGSAPIPTT